MAQSFGDPITLSADWQAVGTVPLRGSWQEKRSGGKVTVRLKHQKHASQSGGYPVVRLRYKVNNAADAEVTSMDSLLDGTITPSGGVATVKAYTPEIEVHALTDSDGSVEYDLVVEVPPYKNAIVLEGKQAGDTTNFGQLGGELDGKI